MTNIDDAIYLINNVEKNLERIRNTVQILNYIQESLGIDCNIESMKSVLISNGWSGDYVQRVIDLINEQNGGNKIRALRSAYYRSRIKEFKYLSQELEGLNLEESLIGNSLEDLKTDIFGIRKRKRSRLTNPDTSISKINWEEPQTIVKYLNQYIISQDHAKKVVAVAFSNHMIRFKTKNRNLPRGNILLIGPSGVGKTYMVSLLAKKASLPMAQTKLSGKSSEGYKGENLSSVFEQIIAHGQDKAPYGIVFFDEIDKLARDDWGSGSGFGPRLQDELIGWLEETAISNQDLAYTSGHSRRLNTKNLLFVTAGAFQGLGEDSLENIIARRLNINKRSIGFSTNSKDSEKQIDKDYLLQKVLPQDLVTYGLKTELIGRFSSIGVFYPLSVEDKVRILIESKNSPLRKYSQLLESKGYELKIEKSVPKIIIDHCPPETGARAIDAICNNLFLEILYKPEKYADENRVIRVTADLTQKLINLYTNKKKKLKVI